MENPWQPIAIKGIHLNFALVCLVPNGDTLIADTFLCLTRMIY